MSSVALPDSENIELTCEHCGASGRGLQCPDCGNTHRPPDRCAADLGVAWLVTDRGVAHQRNEDAAAAGVVRDSEGKTLATVAVVCDGVSSSPHSERASAVASRIGVEACLEALSRQRPAEEASAAGLVAASQEVRALASAQSDAPSCTYVSVVVTTDAAGRAVVTVANVGDSRAYWLAAHRPASPGTELPHVSEAPALPSGQITGSQSCRLTLDDSWAQALVQAGAMDETAAMKDPRAHTLMRWLGADAGAQPWSASSIRTHRPTGPGTVVVCTDGLWNYFPAAADLAGLIADLSPARAAQTLVDRAVAAGGGDNITVAVIPVSPQPRPAHWAVSHD